MDPCNFGAPATTVSNRQILDDFVPQFTHLLTVSTATLDPKYIDTTNEYYQFIAPKDTPELTQEEGQQGGGNESIKRKKLSKLFHFRFFVCVPCNFFEFWGE
jgi:hypothetical protein